MTNSEQNINQQLTKMISDSIVTPLQTEILSLKQELQTIKQQQQIITKVMHADRVLNHYDHIITRLQSKCKITVAFFVLSSQAWKYDTIYKKMVKDDYFEPIIFICPMGQTDEEFFSTKLYYKALMDTYHYFKDSDYEYNVVNTYNEETSKFLEIDDYYSIDLVFFQIPWGSQQRPQYYIHYWSQRALTCHSFYGVIHGKDVGDNLDVYYDQPFHNKLWKYFLESDIHRKLSVQTSSIDSYNTEVTGYCFADQLLDKNHTYQNHWKTTGLKRIIWAPHHYLGNINHSCFTKYASFMLQLIEDYKDNIEIAFRPHPGLKESLYNDPEWGAEKTDTYYDKWKHMTNGQLMKGDYLDYFFTSDAMILDSMSFMTEYLYTQKPSLFTVKDGVGVDSFNEFGVLVFDLLYKGYSKDDILNFVNNIIAEGDDPRKHERQAFLDKHLNISKNGSVSQDIIDYIKQQIQPK